jgi:hypothetical protein
VIRSSFPHVGRDSPPVPDRRREASHGQRLRIRVSDMPRHRRPCHPGNARSKVGPMILHRHVQAAPSGFGRPTSILPSWIVALHHLAAREDS